MNLQQILLSPNGRIGPSSFWRGLIALIGIGAALQVIQVFLPMSLTMLISLLSIGLIYPFVVLFGKRFHDSGRSAWWFLAVLLVWFVVLAILGSVLQGIFAPDMKEMAQIAAESGNLSAVMDMSRSMARKMLLPNLVTAVGIQAGLGYFMANLKSEPGTNRFGPPEGGDVDVFD